MNRLQMSGETSVVGQNLATDGAGQIVTPIVEILVFPWSGHEGAPLAGQSPLSPLRPIPWWRRRRRMKQRRRRRWRMKRRSRRGRRIGLSRWKNRANLRTDVKASLGPQLEDRFLTCCRIVVRGPQLDPRILTSCLVKDILGTEEILRNFHSAPLIEHFHKVMQWARRTSNREQK